MDTVFHLSDNKKICKGWHPKKLRNRSMPLLTVKLINEFVVCICSSFVLLYFRQRAIMLTPAFSIEQDGKNLTIHVKAPLAKVHVNSVVDPILGTLGISHVIVIYLTVP